MKQRILILFSAILTLTVAPAWTQSLSLTMLATLDGENQLDQFGTSVAGVGDVNNDGVDDFLIAAPGWADNVLSDREDDPGVGKAYLYLGGDQLPSTPALEVEGDWEEMNLGCDVAGLGDINGDGIDDFAVGANYLYLSYADVTSVLGKPGLVNVYFGSASIQSAQPLLVQPGRGRQKDRFGTSIASGLDFNGDGHNDMVVSAPGQPEFPRADRPCTEGSEELCRWRVFPPDRVMIYYGGPGFDGEEDVTLAIRDTIFIPEGDVYKPVENWFGEVVATLGDINSDGFDDIGVLERTTRNVYVYFGGSSPSADPGMVITRGKFSDDFGSAMSAVGDVNNDTHDDFAIAAEAADQNGVDAGTVYVYYGGPGLDDEPDLMLYGENPSDRFGSAISYGGDVNNDGADDILISARNATGGDHTLWAGKVYVYYGGPAFDDQPDPTVKGWTNYERFGTAAAVAGDLDSDGYDDIIVGSPIKQSGPRDDFYKGSVYIFGGQPQLTPVYQVYVEAEVSPGAVVLNWSSVADEVPLGYRVLRLEGGLAQAAHEGLLPGSAASFRDTGVQPGRTYEYWIEVVERAGTVRSFGPTHVSVPVAGLLAVGAPYPNPMLSSGMQVQYEGHAVRAGIYDLQGRLVRNLDVAPAGAGGVLSWDGDSETGTAAGGLYFLRVLGEGNRVVTKRVIKLDD